MPAKAAGKPRIRLAVVTDSSACLPPDLLQAHGVITVPLAFQFDGQQYLDGRLPPAEFYRRLEGSRKPPSTAAPAPGEFAAAFHQAHEAGATAVLCLTLSAEYSGTHTAALRAADIARTEIPGLEVAVLDTGGLAMTHGFAVLEAARAAQAGATLAEAAAIAKAVAARARMIASWTRCATRQERARAVDRPLGCILPTSGRSSPSTASSRAPSVAYVRPRREWTRWCVICADTPARRSACTWR
jgi:hypothetical protein